MHHSGLIKCLFSLILVISGISTTPSHAGSPSNPCDSILADKAALREAARKAAANFEAAFETFRGTFDEEAESIKIALVSGNNLLFEGQPNLALSQKIAQLTRNLPAQDFEPAVDFSYENLFPEIHQAATEDMRKRFHAEASQASAQGAAWLHSVLSTFFRDFHALKSTEAKPNADETHTSTVMLAQAHSMGDFFELRQAFSANFATAVTFIAKIGKEMKSYGIDIDDIAAAKCASAAQNIIKNFYRQFPMRFYSSVLSSREATIVEKPTNAGLDLSDLEPIRALQAQVEISPRVESTLSHLVDNFIRLSNADVKRKLAQSKRNTDLVAPALPTIDESNWNSELFVSAKKYLRAIVVLEHLQLTRGVDGIHRRASRDLAVQMSDLAQLKALFCGDISLKSFDLATIYPDEYRKKLLREQSQATPQRIAAINHELEYRESRELNLSRAELGDREAVKNIQSNQAIFEELIALIKP